MTMHLWKASILFGPTWTAPQVVSRKEGGLPIITTTRCAWHSPSFLAWRSVWPGLLVPSPKLEACGTYLWLTHWTSPKINDKTILIYQVTVSAFIVVWKWFKVTHKHNCLPYTKKWEPSKINQCCSYNENETKTTTGYIVMFSYKVYKDFSFLGHNSQEWAVQILSALLKLNVSVNCTESRKRSDQRPRERTYMK